MTERTDVHRPSAINTNDYAYVAIEYMKVEDIGAIEILIAERERFQAHQEKTGAQWSTHQHGGNCHVCGAHCVYTFIFHHLPTNTYIRTGSTCVDKMDCDCGDAFRVLERVKKGVADAREFKAGKTKAKLLLEDEGFGRAWELYQLSCSTNKVELAASQKNELCDMGLVEFKMEKLTCWHCDGYGGRNFRHEDGTTEFQKCEHGCDDGTRTVNVASYVWPFETLIDIVGKLVKWGSISEKQMAFVGKLAEQCDGYKAKQAAYEAKKADERANNEDVPETDERITIEGEILSVKYNEDWGIYQMLVKDDRGFKVWGTQPSKASDTDKGDRIKFDAKVTRSNKDSQFGFFKRPTKVQVAEKV